MQYLDTIFLLFVIFLLILFSFFTTKSDKEFEKWLKKNSVKMLNGYYTFNDDKTNRFYSKSELRDFFNQIENK